MTIKFPIKNNNEYGETEGGTLMWIFIKDISDDGSCLPLRFPKKGQWIVIYNFSDKMDIVKYLGSDNNPKIRNGILKWEEVICWLPLDLPISKYTDNMGFPKEGETFE